ncbi:5'-3' exonuclease H3TH domain-containing protein [Staphylococcus aureus]
MGDTADGYAGVKGIGEKTAIKLIQQYQSIEDVVKTLMHYQLGNVIRLMTI